MDQADLAERARVNVNTVRNMEASGAGPIAGRAVNVQAVQAVLEAAGVEFTNGGHPGVRMRERRREGTGRKAQHRAIVDGKPVGKFMEDLEKAKTLCLEHKQAGPVRSLQVDTYHLDHDPSPVSSIHFVFEKNQWRDGPAP
jgi:hypothetical protein